MTTTAIDQLYRCTPRVARSHIQDCIEVGLVPFLQSSPGMGKSAIVRSIANEYALELKDHRLSTSSPEDLSGLPRFDEDGLARFSPFADLFPIEGTPLPEGKQGWLLFLDEFNSAPKSVQAACYKLILDRMVGQHRLHSNVVIACAGNLASDRAIVNPLSTAMQSRVVHIEMEISHDDWVRDVALKECYDERILAYLNFKPSALLDFKPDHQDRTFACPRTWEFMNKLIKEKPVTDEKTSLYAGVLTSGIAVEFVQFTKVFASMVSAREVEADPTGAPISNDVATKWAVITHLLTKATEKTLAAFCTYVDRFDLTFRIIFYRGITIQQPALATHPSMRKALVDLSRYLS